MVIANLTYLDGAQERLELGNKGDPLAFFQWCMACSFSWMLDYSQGTPEELERWFYADVISRCERALEVRDLPVIIEEQEFGCLNEVQAFFRRNYRPVVRCYDDECEGVTITLGETVH